jgi:hypothetical protein
MLLHHRAPPAARAGDSDIVRMIFVGDDRLARADQVLLFQQFNR